MTHQYSGSLLPGVQVGGATHKLYMFVSGTIVSLLRTTVLQTLFPYMPYIRRFFFPTQTGLYIVKGKNLDSGRTLR